MAPEQKNPANVSISSVSQSGGVPVWRRSGRHGDETDCIIGSAAVWRDRRTEGRRDRRTDAVGRTRHVLPPFTPPGAVRHLGRLLIAGHLRFVAIASFRLLAALTPKEAIDEREDATFETLWGGE